MTTMSLLLEKILKIKLRKLNQSYQKKIKVEKYKLIYYFKNFFNEKYKHVYYSTCCLKFIKIQYI